MSLDPVYASLRLVCILLFLGFGPGGMAQAEEGRWLVGFARAKITPKSPVVLAGYAQRREPFSGVAQDLYVKAMSLEDDAGHRALLITCDFIGFRAVTAEPFIERIMKASGLERAQILVNSSHTHTGPSQAHAPTAASYLGTEETRNLYEYTMWLHDRIVATALSALADVKPASLTHGNGVAPFVMNRREPTANGIVLGVNPRGPADRTVPVLKVTTPDGRVIGIVFGAACHNTTIPHSDNQVCGDFAGYAQERIESAHPGSQAMFMQGCGGDAGPWPTGSLEHAQQHGVTLGDEVTRLIASDRMKAVRGPLQTRLEKVSLPLEPPPTLSEIEAMQASPAAWKRWVGNQMLERYQAGVSSPTHYDAPLALWQFGSDLTLIGYPGEAVVDYVALTERALGNLNLWIAAYCNDVFGYLPTARILREGGYETRGLYSGEAFAPEVESVIHDALRRLGKSAGRDTSGADHVRAK